MAEGKSAAEIDAFIARWAKSSGAERANFQMFAIELCGLIGVTPPEPARGEDAELNDYCFERGVTFKPLDGSDSPGRIDLYKRGSFVMEAKQSREKGRPKEYFHAHDYTRHRTLKHISDDRLGRIKERIDLYIWIDAKSQRATGWLFSDSVPEHTKMLKDLFRQARERDFD